MRSAAVSCGTPNPAKRCVPMRLTVPCAMGVLCERPRLATRFPFWGARSKTVIAPRTISTPVAQIEEPAVTETTTTTTTFKTAVGLAFGEVVKVVGSSDSLGNWDVEAAPAMTWGQGDEWTLELPLEAGDYSFKFVACNTATGECRWEGGGDRTITVTDEPTPAFVRGNWDDTNATEVLSVVLAGEDVPSALPTDSVVLIQREGEESSGLQSELDETAAYVKAMLEALEDQEQQVAEKLEQTVKDAKLDEEVAAPIDEEVADPLDEEVADAQPTKEEAAAPAEALAAVQPLAEQHLAEQPVEEQPAVAAAAAAAVVEDVAAAPKVQEQPTLEVAAATPEEAAVEAVQEQAVVQPAPIDMAAQQTEAATETTHKEQAQQPPPPKAVPSGVPALVSIPVALSVALAAPIVLWSEATLRLTGCGLEPGPGGLLGAIEGVSYLVVFLVALAGIGRLASSRTDRTGDVGLLGAAEAVSWLTVGVGVLVLLWQVKEFGYLPGAVPDARCFPDQVDVVFDPSAANWAALGRLLRGVIGL